MFDLRNYKAFIFDLDNTLIASENQHTAAFAKAMLSLADYALTPRDVEDYRGNTSVAMAAVLLNRICNTSVTPKMVAAQKAKYAEADFTLIPYPGAADFVRLAHGHVKLSVASNSPAAFVNSALEGMGILPLMDAVITIENVHAPKPNPEILLKAAEANGCSPNECLLFEDSGLGIKAGISAGMDTVLLVNPGNIIPEYLPENMPTLTWHALNTLAKDAFHA